jgi:hypothetical protein
LKQLLFARYPSAAKASVRGCTFRFEQPAGAREHHGAIESGEYDGPLADHGLAGEQLRLKMALFDIAVLDYDQERRSGLARFRPWREAEAGRRILEIADKILGSIAAATPVAGADAAEELKQAFEWALGLSKRWRRRRSRPTEWEGIQPF